LSKVKARFIPSSLEGIFANKYDHTLEFVQCPSVSSLLFSMPIYLDYLDGNNKDVKMQVTTMAYT
jgi:hypothetical protein